MIKSLWLGGEAGEVAMVIDIILLFWGGVGCVVFSDGAKKEMKLVSTWPI